MRIVLFLIFILSSCAKDVNNSSNFAQNTQNFEENTQNTSINTLAKKSLILNIAGEQLQLNGTKYQYSSEESVEIDFPKGLYIYTWQRQGDDISLLGEYTFSKEDEATKFFSLKDFSRDTDWFVIASEKPLGLSKNKIRNFVNSVKQNKNDRLVKPYAWKIYTTEVNNEKLSNIEMQVSVNIFHTAFSFKTWSKNGNADFLPQRRQKLTADTQLKFEFEMLEPSHFAMFLCSAAENKITSVTQIFPEKNGTTSKLEKGFKWKKTLQKPIKASDENNQQWMYCFTEKEPLDTKEIKQWLSTKVRGFDAVVSLTTNDIQTLKETEGINVLGEDNNIVIVEKDFSHVKIGLQTN